MTTWTVKQTGGHYSTLQDAVSNASTIDGDTIQIEDAWSVADDGDAAINITQDNLTIIAVGDAAYTGGAVIDDDTTSGHYRLWSTAHGDHVIEVDAGVTGFEIQGVVIKQDGTGSSDEGIRVATTSLANVKNCVIYASATTSASQDGIYTTTASSNIYVENTIIWGFNRSGIHIQDATGVTLDVNSCAIYNCGHAGSSSNAAASGIGADHRSDSSVISVYNSWLIGNDNGFAAEDLEIRDNTNITLDVAYSIVGDASITANADTNTSNLENRTLVTANDGNDNVIVTTISGNVNDFTLVSDAANNDAQDAHSDLTELGMTLPTLDIQGITRDTATGKVDIGPFAFAAAGGGGDVLDFERGVYRGVYRGMR